jgi:hypothetical protein
VYYLLGISNIKIKGYKMTPATAVDPVYANLQIEYDCIISEFRGNLENRTVLTANNVQEVARSVMEVTRRILQMEESLSQKVTECKEQGGKIEEIAKILRPGSTEDQREFLFNEQHGKENRCLSQRLLCSLLVMRR